MPKRNRNIAGEGSRAYTLDGFPVDQIREGMTLQWVSVRDGLVTADVCTYCDVLCVRNGVEYIPIKDIAPVAEIVRV